MKIIMGADPAGFELKNAIKEDLIKRGYDVTDTNPDAPVLFQVAARAVARGALIYDGKESKYIPCFKVNAVDSTAAGDTFGACLAIQLCKGVPMEEAIVTAHAAAGICVSRQGAQISIPTEDEVEQFLQERTGGKN